MALIKTIDITPGGTTPTIYVSQDDVGRTITVAVTDGTDWYDLTDKTVKLQGTKPSGLGYSVNGTVNGHQVTFTTTKAMTDEYGKIASEIVVTSGQTVIGSCNCILSVEKNPHPDWTPDGSIEDIIPEAQQILINLQTANAEADANIATMASLKNAAEAAADEAEAAADRAESVFSIAGNVAFAINPDKSVTVTFTEEE